MKITKGVSYLPIPIPKWAQISTDKTIFPNIPPVTNISGPLLLSQTSRCSCGAAYNPNNATFLKDCIIYTLTQSFHSQIQLQVCPQCQSSRYQAIGPDCRDLGLLNVNNHALFSHDLLEEYTAAYTSSETPFTAWVKTVSIRYDRYNPGSSFVDEKVFRTAWFIYARLLTLDGDFQCPKCGPTPTTVIWDGVTLAFNKKYLQPTLYPPTTIHPNSIQRTQSYLRQQSFIKSLDCQKLIGTIFSGPLYIPPTIVTSNTPDEDGSDNEELQHQTKKIQDILSRIKQIPLLEALLGKESQDLLSFFQKYCASSVLLLQKKCPSEVVAFFKQVCYFINTIYSY